MTINIGDRVQDTVTDFTGTCTAKTYWLNGCVRCSVLPPGVDKDGKPRKPEVIDEVQLITLIPGAVPITACPPDRVHNGDRVVDLPSNIEGVVVAKSYYISGLVRCIVQQKELDKDGNPQEVMVFDEPQLQILVAKAIPQPEAAKTAPAGPRPPVERRVDSSAHRR